jgi:hypothetical protein
VSFGLCLLDNRGSGGVLAPRLAGPLAPHTACLGLLDPLGEDLPAALVAVEEVVDAKHGRSTLLAVCFGSVEQFGDQQLAACSITTASRSREASRSSIRSSPFETIVRMVGARGLGLVR